MPRDAAVADIPIVRGDGAQPAAVREDEIPGGVVAHGPGNKDDRRARAVLFVPESQPVVDAGWHADKDALFPLLRVSNLREYAGSFWLTAPGTPLPLPVRESGPQLLRNHPLRARSVG